MAAHGIWFVTQCFYYFVYKLYWAIYGSFGGKIKCYEKLHTNFYEKGLCEQPHIAIEFRNIKLLYLAGYN